MEDALDGDCAPFYELHGYHLGHFCSDRSHPILIVETVPRFFYHTDILWTYILPNL